MFQLGRIEFYTENLKCLIMLKYSELSSSISNQQLNLKGNVSKIG